MTITILFTQNNMAKKQISQEQVWDKIAPFWNKYKSEPKLRYKPSLLNDFIKKTDKKVLDLGCGSGRNFFKFNLVSSGSIIIQTLGVSLATAFFGREFWYIYKIAIITFIIIPYSYILYNKLIWKDK